MIGIDPQLVDPDNGDYRVTPGSPAEDYGCQIFPTEKIETTYNNNKPIIPCSQSENKSSIEVSGVINESTLWQVDTVRVVGDIEVSDGAILTISPNTKVEFQDFYSLNIKGSIQALGESDERIAFTSAHPELFIPDSSTSGSWNGIRFHNTSSLNDPSLFTYCSFEHSKTFGDSIKGGVISFYNYSPVKVINCSFTQNVADYGSVLGFDHHSSPEITGCLFTKNYAIQGGSPIYCAYSYPKLTNNTFIDNYVFNEDIFYKTAAVQTFISKPKIINNIIRDNVTNFFDPAQLVECKDFYTTYNNIEYGHGGIGNIDEDPFFIYSGEFPYSLLQFSPCIDAGISDTSGLHLPLFDHGGEERIYAGRIDIGAFEWQGYAIDDEPDQDNEIQIWSSPNPFSSSTTISFSGKINSDELQQIKIYNVKGQLVRNFGFRISDCGFSVVWDGRDNNGNILPTGIYLYNLFINNKTTQTKKLILIVF